MKKLEQYIIKDLTRRVVVTLYADGHYECRSCGKRIGECYHVEKIKNHRAEIISAIRK